MAERSASRAFLAGIVAVTLIAVVSTAIAFSAMQDFDTPGGTPFVGANAPGPNTAPPPAVTGPDAHSSGQFLRMQVAPTRRSVNTMGFDLTDAGAYYRIIADFDFRITCDGARTGFSGGGCADGFSFVLLDTSVHGTSGAPGMELSLAEHGGTNLGGQFGFGFNTFYNFGFVPDAGSSNSLSMIYHNGFVPGSFVDLNPFGFDLATGTFGNFGPFHHASIELVLGPGSPHVTMTLTSGVTGAVIKPFDNFDLSAVTSASGPLAPFESRPGFGVRCGDACADYDIDNVVVQYLDPVAGPSNQMPTADAGPDQTVELAGPGGTAVTLNGLLSSDPDGDPLTFSWSGPFPEGGGTVTGSMPTVTLAEGTHTITLTVMDTLGETDTDEVSITVEDTVAPTIASATSDVSVIATPNHKMIPVNLSVVCSDASGSHACEIVGVTSNEAINGLGDGNTDPDWIITGPLTVELRAERSGTGNGRIYTITVECVDAAGNAAYADVTVTVPKSQGKKK